MKDNVVWIQDIMEAFNPNDIWWQGMTLFCKNISANYHKVTKRTMTVDEIDIFLANMKNMLYDENEIQLETEESLSET